MSYKNIRKVRVLHLASFIGNIGDLANHAGSRRMLKNHLQDYCLEYTELEIREFYWQKRKFDDEFVNYANSFDLLIVGGGNYFELWVDNSETGTSIDISLNLLKSLKVPTIFYSLGVDTGQGYSANTVKRFSAFINELLSRKDIFVCVRNDGSSKALTELLGPKVSCLIPTMPDGGFFASANQAPSKNAIRDRIGINIAGDMHALRFNNSFTADQFLDELGRVCCSIMDARPNLQVDFIPHIWRDNIFISQLLPLIPDSYLRGRITISKLEARKAGLLDFLNNYQSHDLVLGMRFHANVCPIGMGVPTRGLLNYPQIKHLFDEIEMKDRTINVQKANFGNLLIDAVLSDFEDLPRQQANCKNAMDLLNHQALMTLNMMNQWFQHNLG